MKSVKSFLILGLVSFLLGYATVQGASAEKTGCPIQVTIEMVGSGVLFLASAQEVTLDEENREVVLKGLLSKECNDTIQEAAFPVIGVFEDKDHPEWISLWIPLRTDRGYEVWIGDKRYSLKPFKQAQKK